MSFVIAAPFRRIGPKGEVISLIRASSFRVRFFCVCVYSYRLLGLKVQGGCGVQRVDPFGSTPAPAAQEPQAPKTRSLVERIPPYNPQTSAQALQTPGRAKKPWLSHL